MCQFFSCLVLKDGSLCWHGLTNSHEDLVRVFQPGKDDGETFVRVEFIPPASLVGQVGQGVFASPEAWTLKVDEAITPPWWAKKELDVEKSLCALIKRFQTVPPGGLVLDQPVIIKAERVEIRAGICFASGSATVEARGSATVMAHGSATVKAYNSATVMAHGSATVEAHDSATVKAQDSATVEAWGSATVKAWGSATVRAYGLITVEAYASATVEAYDFATVKAYDSATVKAHGSATVKRF
jgi:hypothetical protein